MCGVDAHHLVPKKRQVTEYVRFRASAIARRARRPMSAIGNRRQWEAPTRPSVPSLKRSFTDVASGLKGAPAHQQRDGCVRPKAAVRRSAAPAHGKILE